MPRQARIEFEGALYHVIARGLDRRPLFRDDEDHAFYLRKLSELPDRFGAQLLAFCLAPGHLHLAIQVKRVPLSRIMKALHTAYAVAFNRRHGRTGPIFQGRYRALVVDPDSSLLALVRYIHLDPVAARLAVRPEDYRWSSHALYLRETPAWLAASDVLGRFGDSRAASRKAFQRFVNGAGAASYTPEAPLAGAVAGNEGFARKALRAGGREDLLARLVTVEGIARSLAEREGVRLEELRGKARTRRLSRLRTLCALVGRDLAGIPVARAARFFGRDPSTLSRDLGRMERILAAQPAARREVDQLVASLIRPTRTVPVNNTRFQDRP